MMVTIEPEFSVLPASFDVVTVVEVLAHTLWQAAIWAGLLWCLLRLVDPRQSSRRYVLGLVALGGVAVSPFVTYSVLRFAPTPSANVEVSEFGSDARSPVTISGHVEEAEARWVASRSSARTAVASSAGNRYRHVANGVLAVWLIGATWMLIRRARSVLAAHSLADGPQVTDPNVLAIVRQVCRELSVSRNVRVVASELVSTPLVVGAWRPTLVLPLSLMTGLAPAELHAMFAHEMAHVRRHDALVNLFQLFIEALLFFNPAVWWISRQVRRERDACCDAMAASLTGGPVSYAEVLVGWVQRVRDSATGSRVGLAGDGVPTGVPFEPEPGSLGDRIERLVATAARPNQRVSMKTFLVVTFLAIAASALLQQGADVVVYAAGQLFTDEQRVERIAETRTEIEGDAVADAPGNYVITGRVRTHDGGPLERVSAVVVTFSEGGTTSASVGLRGNEFRREVPIGRTWVGVRADGYAPTILGPFSGAAGTTKVIETVELRPGFQAGMRIVDESGDPVVAARARMSPLVNGMTVVSTEPIDVVDGTAKLEHLLDTPYRLNVEADGYQPKSLETGPIEPDGMVQVELQRATPTSGVVVDDAGEPVEGVEVCQGRLERPGYTLLSRRRLAVTDSVGRFELNQLRNDSTYTLFLKHRDRVTQLIDEVRAGQPEKTWTLTKPIETRGRVIGWDRDASPAEIPELQFSNRVGLPPYDDTVPGSRGEVEIDASGNFVIENLSPGRLVLRFDGRSETFPISGSRDDLVFDVSKEEPKATKREVRITFRGPNGPAPIRGSAEWYLNHRGADGAITNAERVAVSLDGASLRLDAFAPGIISGNGGGAIGFWFDSVRIDVPAGDEPLEATIDVLPAGAITGRVLDHQGNPLTGRGVNVGCKMSVPPEPGKPSTHFLGNTRVNENGEFFLSPVILGAETVVSVTDGFNIQIAETVTLRGDRPTAEVELRMSKPVDVAGVVVDESGNQLADVPLKFHFEHEHKSTSFSPETVTDREGRFAFRGIASSVGQYSVEVASRKGFVPVRLPLPVDGTPIELRLQEGLEISGVVTDRSGAPVAGVEVEARPVDREPDDPRAYSAEGRTDVEGQFRFSNLPDRPMRLFARPIQGASQTEVRPGPPGRTPHVTIQGEVPDWHRSKP